VPPKPPPRRAPRTIQGGFAALRVDLSDRDAVAAFAAGLATTHTTTASCKRRHTYDALAMMMDQAKAEVAMQVNTGRSRALRAAGAPDDARSPRPHRP